MNIKNKYSGKIEFVRNFPESAKCLPLKKRMVAYGIYVLVLLAATIALGVSSMLLAYGPFYSVNIFFNYFTNAYLVLLNLLPPIALFALLYGIIRRAWIAYLIDSLVVIGLSTANYFMLMFRNDPLMFSDVLYIREAVEISKEGYNYRLTPEIAAAVAVCAFFTLLLFVFRGRRLKASTGIYAVAVVVLVSMMSGEIYFSDKVYDTETDVIDENHMNRWSPTNQYLSKGFVYPFIRSAELSLEFPPEDYDDKQAKILLSDYKDSKIPDDKKVNIVAVMLEAYSDLEKLGVYGIDDGAYANYRKIRDENLSGTLVTNIFAAGTIDSERGFLTGFTGLEHCRRNINSYVRYFSSQGYNTTGSHPSEDWFYNRKNVNSYIGFDEYLFKENYYEEKFGEYMRNDNVLFDDMYDQYVERAESGEPVFSFHVTYQGHGPYAVSYRGWGTDENPLYVNEYISEESENIINNYLGSLRSTGEHLGVFVEKMMAREEPVILVLFGDHKPWLGDSNSVYNELGISFDLSTKEGFLNYYSTEYVIVANDAAKKALGKDFSGDGGMTSPCFLMNVLFEQMGIEGSSFMKFTDNIRQTIIAVNKEGVIDANGNFYSVEFMPESIKKVYDEYKNVTYFEKTNFRK